MKVLITIPVYNEEKILEKNIVKLNNFLKKNFSYDYTIEIVNNSSTDNTGKIAKELSKRYKEINYINILGSGKGHAIKESWKKAKKPIEILSFMDADLATDLKDFQKLIDTIFIEKYDISIGSRYNKYSEVKRTLDRLILSKVYIYLQKIFFKINYEDTQCGFKAINRKKYQTIEKEIKDNNFFFDTELLLIATKKYKYTVKSIPVKWREEKNSKVNIIKTTYFFLKNLWRMFWYFKKVK